NLSSAQADSAIVDALLSAGADIEQLEDGGVRVRATDLLGFEFDATHSPDLFPALALLASACRGESVITGVSRLKHKESDRAAAIACEFAKAGVRIEVDGDFMRVWGTEKILAADFDAWNDHRIAMSTAILALRATQKSTLTGAESVNKSYPEFWNDLEILKK
ncbi:MAG: 3-phosphoshikimate 1-carboxyvinyltransferase, partial [Rikenellaceae bacterium]